MKAHKNYMSNLPFDLVRTTHQPSLRDRIYVLDPNRRRLIEVEA